MLEKPMDVMKSIVGYMSEGVPTIIAKISECKVYCTVGDNTYIHTLNGVSFNHLINAFTLLDIEFKVS